MVTLEDLYSGRILELAANLSHIQRLSSPDATAVAHSKLCGSRVTVDINMDGDVVTAYGQDVKACLLGQASASVVGDKIIGSTASELRAVRQQLRKMLKETGQPPSGKWADLAALQPVREYPPRHAATLLVFDAVEDAIRQIEARKAASS